ncbi:MAG: histidinol-phosphate transaminase [Patescibacteria group bacterium]
MINLANKQIQAMQPYSPPIENRRAYRGLLLDFSERAVPPSQKVLDALKDFLIEPRLQLYPEYGDICEAIAKYAGVPPAQIMITNGSDQGIDLIFRTFTKSGDRVVIPKPSFAMFYQCSQIENNNLAAVNYREDFSYPLEKTLTEIEKGARLVVVCNPNNPTGTLTSLQDVEIILRRALDNDAMVYVDEAYYEFAGVTAVPLLKKYPNLVITRTFSKAFGLVALRIGYVVAREEYIKEFLKVRGAYDINMPAGVAVRAALMDLKSVKKYVDEVMNKAKPMVEKFFRANGVIFYPSAANFILFRPDNPVETNKKLLDGGIRLRVRQEPEIKGTIRLSIGTVKQMKKFIEVYSRLSFRAK